MTTNDIDPPVLSRPLKVDEIKDGTERRDRGHLAPRLRRSRGLLDLVALEAARLVLSTRSRRAGGRLQLTGQLQADVVQTCVVSLEPVEAQLDVPVEVEFWPAARVDELERKR